MTQKSTENNSINLIAKASAKSIKTSSQKANLVLKLIRGQKVDKAMNILEFSRKKNFQSQKIHIPLILYSIFYGIRI